MWNRYAKKLLQLCNTPLIVKLFADKIAIAAEDISSTGKKWVDLTVFSAFASEKLRDAFTQELLKLGIDVLDNEQNITDASLLSTSEGYNYDAVGYIRYLNAGVTSKDDFQRMKREYANSLKALLGNIRREKGEHKVTESTLYLCSIEEIIQAADVNLNLEKLSPPWKECEGLHPLEGNLAVALGAIANTESEHEWTIVLDGVVDNKRLYVSQELQESISQAIGMQRERVVTIRLTERLPS